jgi:hypothetical protein
MTERAPGRARTDAGGPPLGVPAAGRRSAPRAGLLRGSALAAAFGIVFVAAPLARAQSAPQLRLEAEGTVAVGETFELRLGATSADTMPTDPQPGPTAGFVVRGQNQAPSQTHIIINGARTDRYTLNVSWALEAQRVGTFHVGPASAVVGSARHRSQPVTITVVPAGQAPRRHPTQPQLPPGFQSPFGMNPFDMWKGFMQGFDNDQAPAAPSPPEPQVDPRLSLDTPRGAVFFLHATVDKATVAVGEQVTFSIYQYVDTASHGGSLDAEDAHDATAADFAKHVLLREDQASPLEGLAAAGGRTWEVRLLRRWALFPLRAGNLTIGPMSLSLIRAGATASEPRTSETLQVRAVEPPLARRPPGYALGDVGRFSLAAQVSPRQVEQGAAVAVHVELSGTGNVPSALSTPAREGVEWLAPEVKEDLGAIGKDHAVFGGKRFFDYVVRMNRPGAVDLGEMTLPFWDPAQQRYDVARAMLGDVRVTPSAAAAAARDTPQDLLPGLPAPRDILEGAPSARAHLDDSRLFWLAGVAGWPAAFGLAVGGRGAGRRALGAWRRRRESPAAELRNKLAAAHVACRADDPRGADAAIGRALEAAAVAHAGVSVRGALRDEVAARLERAGVAGQAASDVAGLLRECEAARFSPETAGMAAARDRWRRAQGAIRSLEKGG